MDNNLLLAQEAKLDFSSPQATLKTYLAACSEMNFEQSDQCYTREFQHFTKTDAQYLAHRHPGQLQNQYIYLRDRKYQLEMHDNKAIMRFSPVFTRPEPLYFVRENGEWKIDGQFSFDHVVIEDSQRWHWRNSDLNNERLWLEK